MRKHVQQIPSQAGRAFGSKFAAFSTLAWGLRSPTGWLVQKALPRGWDGLALTGRGEGAKTSGSSRVAAVSRNQNREYLEGDTREGENRGIDTAAGGIWQQNMRKY